VVARHRPRRMHIDISPPVETEISERRVRFVGLHLISNRVMVEYDVYPPLQRDTPFGPVLLELLVTDDIDGDAYPTCWEDFLWPTTAPNRVTTRLDQRPPAEARQLHIEVHPVTSDPSTHLDTHDQIREPLAHFVVALPPEHGLPWQSDAGVA
jgi:hypothetical protein